jgi:hypothetical protein
MAPTMTGRPVRRAREAAGERAPATPPRSLTGSPSPVHNRAAANAASYEWESFEQGNWLSLRHGAHSPRLTGRLVEDLVGILCSTFPDLAQPRYRLAVRALARAETRVALLALFLDARGVADAEGEPRDRLMKELRAEERRAGEERRALGLDPSAHARLVRDRADATEASWRVDDALAAGREVIALRGSDDAGDPP